MLGVAACASTVPTVLIVPCYARRYVHRVGRTARMGHAGAATLLLLPSEADYVTLLRSHGVRPQLQPLAAVLRHLPAAEAAVVRVYSTGFAIASCCFLTARFSSFCMTL